MNSLKIPMYYYGTLIGVYVVERWNFSLRGREGTYGKESSWDCGMEMKLIHQSRRSGTSTHQWGMLQHK